MSKEYKFKKPLPDTDAGTRLFEQKGGYYYYKNRYEEDRMFDPRHVEGNIEWFEEVKPKEWEIVSGRGHNGHIHQWYEGNSCLEQKCDIHSVKRLSDGEVFTLGDKVEYRSTDDAKWADVGFGEIIRIRPSVTTIEQLVFLIEHNDDKDDAGKFISNIRHKKPQASKERIEVSKIEISTPIPKEMFPAIKSAIENVLNGTSTLYDCHQEALELLSKSFTPEQVEERERLAFEAGRDIPQLANPTKRFRFDDYEHFKKHAFQTNHQRSKQ